MYQLTAKQLQSKTPSLRALWNIDSCQISSFVKYRQNKETNVHFCIIHVFSSLLHCYLKVYPAQLDTPCLTDNRKTFNTSVMR